MATRLHGSHVRKEDQHHRPVKSTFGVPATVDLFDEYRLYSKMILFVPLLFGRKATRKTPQKKDKSKGENLLRLYVPSPPFPPTPRSRIPAFHG